MKLSVTTRCIAGKQLLGVARHHAVLTDRTREKGGSDIGCTSGELLLLAIASCAAGGLRNHIEAQGHTPEALRVTAFFEAPPDPGARDRIVLSIALGTLADRVDPDAIRTAAVSGGVTSRIHADCGLEVRIADTCG